MNEKTVPTLKFVLEDEKGSKWNSGVTWQERNQKMKWLEERYEWCSNEILKLRTKVQVLERPLKKTQILELLQTQTAPRTSRFFSNRLDGFDWVAFNELLDEGKIEKVRRGKLTLYQLKKV